MGQAESPGLCLQESSADGYLKGGWALLGAAQCQDKEQRAQNGTQNVPSGREEPLLPHKGGRALEQSPERWGISLSKAIRTHLDAFLCNLLQGTCSGGGWSGSPDVPSKSYSSVTL